MSRRCSFAYFFFLLCLIQLYRRCFYVVFLVELFLCWFFFESIFVDFQHFTVNSFLCLCVSGIYSLLQFLYIVSSHSFLQSFSVRAALFSVLFKFLMVFRSVQIFMLCTSISFSVYSAVFCASHQQSLFILIKQVFKHFFQNWHWHDSIVWLIRFCVLLQFSSQNNRFLSIKSEIRLASAIWPTFCLFAHFVCIHRNTMSSEIYKCHFYFWLWRRISWHD